MTWRAIYARPYPAALATTGTAEVLLEKFAATGAGPSILYNVSKT
jgi:hypothetical protein